MVETKAKWDTLLIRNLSHNNNSTYGPFLSCKLNISRFEMQTPFFLFALLNFYSCRAKRCFLAFAFTPQYYSSLKYAAVSHILASVSGATRTEGGKVAHCYCW